MLKDIFPIQIYEATFENYSSIKNSLVNQILPFFSDKEQHSHKLFLNGYSISEKVKDLHTRINAPELIDFVNLHLQEYWIQSGFTKLLKPYILHSWANVVPPGGSLHLHNHNPNVIAGVFYVNANNNHGNLQLENPLNLLLGRLPWDRTNSSPINFEQEIAVDDGKLIMFPGWLNHRTPPNRDSTDRIVMGFNFACHGEKMKVNEVY
jgi:uncharacterized protein (TIGR02466 family)